MNAELKQQWVEALRSGDYTQTQGYLHLIKIHDHSLLGEMYHDDAHCCLGVLCEVRGLKQQISANDHSVDFGEYLFEDCTPMAAKFSQRVRHQFGLTADQEDTLISMNDAGRTFDEIADWIEENL